MDDRRRTLLAIGLLLVVAIIPSLLRRNEAPTPTRAPVETQARADTARADTARPEHTAAPAPVPDSGQAAVPSLPPSTSSIGSPETEPADPAEEVVYVRSPLYQFGFSTRGARLVQATLHEYESLAPGERGNDAQLIPNNSEFLTYRVVFGNDTLDLSRWTFEPSSEVVEVAQPGTQLQWVGRQGNVTVRITYTFRPDHYLFDAEGEIEGVGTASGLVLVGLGPRLRSVEVDSLDDQRSYGIVTKARNTVNHKYSALEYGERLELAGPFEWVAIKSKYFLGVVLAIEEGQPSFGGGLAIGGPSYGDQETEAHVSASLPMPSGTFSHSAYIGPQEYRRLARIGHDLQDVNPYGWIFRPIIGPVSVLIVRALLWLHENLNWGYGWLLILFGVGVRVLLWPLNQKAMRSQMSMQALQPEIEAIRKKHQGDQGKIGQETMQLYKERGVNPFGSCLPMLIPMPILFAFFFVFLNTIELRGVSFLWLPDLARFDPYYVLPLLMGLSMFGVSKIGQIGIPPNPQAKMMTYVMPVMFTVFFFRFASGLCLYYASQNLASIPQQWMIAKERLRKAGKKPPAPRQEEPAKSEGGTPGKQRKQKRR
jgi:YidC/Oxa1 family membrane protein insertase